MKRLLARDYYMKIITIHMVTVLLLMKVTSVINAILDMPNLDVRPLKTHLRI